MSGVAQLPLDLGHRPALDREDFLVAGNNQAAVAWIDRWPEWPSPVIALYGPAGCGKTHLCQVWRKRSGAVQIDAAGLAAAEPPALLGEAKACVIDGIEAALTGNRDLQQRLFHLHNMMVERRGYLLLAGRLAPARWACELADLQSRLSAAMAIEVGAPDDVLIEAVLVKLFADRQLKVGPEVIRYLLPRMERSFAAARALVATADRESLAARREITIPLLRGVLQNQDLEPL